MTAPVPAAKIYPHTKVRLTAPLGPPGAPVNVGATGVAREAPLTPPFWTEPAVFVFWDGDQAPYPRWVAARVLEVVGE